MKLGNHKTKSIHTPSTPETDIFQESKLLSLKLCTENPPNEILYPAEVVESLRKAISRLISKKSLPHRLSIVSALRQEGVTYLTRAMAMIIANDLNTSVCAVELNWWRPDRSLRLLKSNPGLAGILMEDVDIDDALVCTSQPQFSILPAGKMAVADRPVWARSDLLKEVLFKLGEHYEYLLLDIPAILVTNDTIPLASLGDACCLVVHQGITSIDKVRMALDEINHLTVLGIVLNKVRVATPEAVLNLIPQDPGLETGDAPIA